MATYNKSLGKFQLTGIPPAPRGIPQIEVGFDIDANGILNVSAKDLGTGKEQKIEIKAGSGLSDDEIKRMVSDAESHAEDDKRRREEAEVRNNADSLVYQTEKVLREHGDKISGTEKDAVDAALTELKSAVEGDDVERIRKATESLMTASQSFSQKLYESAGAEGAAAGGGTSTPNDDDVVDAEIVDDQEGQAS
jgi:molecular chaperone DnaK